MELPDPPLAPVPLPCPAVPAVPLDAPPEPLEASVLVVEPEMPPPVSPAVAVKNPTEADPMLPDTGQRQALSTTVAHAASNQPQFFIPVFSVDPPAAVPAS